MFSSLYCPYRCLIDRTFWPRTYWSQQYSCRCTVYWHSACWLCLLHVVCFVFFLVSFHQASDSPTWAKASCSNIIPCEALKVSLNRKSYHHVFDISTAVFCRLMLTILFINTSNCFWFQFWTNPFFFFLTVSDTSVAGIALRIPMKTGAGVCACPVHCHAQIAGVTHTASPASLDTSSMVMAAKDWPFLRIFFFTISYQNDSCDLYNASRVCVWYSVLSLSVQQINHLVKD